MKKLVQGMSLLVLLAALGALPAVAQIGSIKGVAKDAEGKLITDGTVEITNIDNQRKMTVKTNKNGEYLAMGLTAGTYDVVLMRNGVVVDGVNKVPVGVGEPREVNFDLKKDNAKGGGPSEEQIKNCRRGDRPRQVAAEHPDL